MSALAEVESAAFRSTGMMAGETIARVAAATRIRAETVAVHYREIRQAGLTSKGRRGRGGAVMTSLDLSRLLISLLSGEAVTGADTRVRQYGALPNAGDYPFEEALAALIEGRMDEHAPSNATYAEVLVSEQPAGADICSNESHQYFGVFPFSLPGIVTVRKLSTETIWEIIHGKKMDEESADDEMGTAAYLRDLADRIFRIPAMYGVDQGDYDRLREIATNWEAAFEDG